MEYSVVICAAGKGTRTNLSYNKVLYQIDDETVIEKTLKLFIKDNECKEIVLVINPSEKAEFLKLNISNKVKFASGGATRQDSVYNGLQEVNSEFVMIQDGARCYLSQGELESLKECLNNNDACLLMVPVTDTIKRVINGKVEETYNRDTLMAAQTPQCFKTSLIIDCHKIAKANNFVGSDDAMLVEKFSKTDVIAVLGEYTNKKITTPLDL